MSDSIYQINNIDNFLIDLFDTDLEGTIREFASTYVPGDIIVPEGLSERAAKVWKDFNMPYKRYGFSFNPLHETKKEGFTKKDLQGQYRIVTDNGYNIETMRMTILNAGKKYDISLNHQDGKYFLNLRQEGRSNLDKSPEGVSIIEFLGDHKELTRVG